MDQLQTIQKDLREVKALLRQASKVKNWVLGQAITQLTIWDDKEKLRNARDNGYIEFKSAGKKTLLYNLDSIHPLFIRRDEKTNN